MQIHDKDSTGRKQNIIACEVFQGALRYLGIDRQDAPNNIIYLPSHLHLYPERLKQQMLRCLESGGISTSYAGCLYGQCFPDIDTVLSTWKIERITCGHCYEILLGRAAYRELMAYRPGSFFLEKAVIEDFDRLCCIPLELDDPQMRSWYFEHYQQVVYIRQPLDPDLMGEVRSIAQMLSLDCTVLDANYSDLISYLKNHDIL